jgi:hypothetical protein
MPSRSHALLVVALGAALLASACSDDTQSPPPDLRVPDFSLPDVNPASPRAGTNVSPRDYEGQVSAWYFGHAT